MKVQQLRQGKEGRTLARLYMDSERIADLEAGKSRPTKREPQQTVRSKTMQGPSKSPQIRLEKKERMIASASNDRILNSGKAKDAATAGSRNGSLLEGDLTGSEVRPALWIAGPNPAIAAEELAAGLEGSVVVEITIDDQGNVVGTVLLQSLSPEVDARVIQALQLAHFVPAKRNGVSIPSKQDVYYHFPR